MEASEIKEIRYNYAGQIIRAGEPYGGRPEWGANEKEVLGVQPAERKSAIRKRGWARLKETNPQRYREIREKSLAGLKAYWAKRKGKGK